MSEKHKPTPTEHALDHLRLPLLFVRSRRKLRAAIAKVRRDGLSEKSFVEFMDTVVPGWRSGR